MDKLNTYSPIYGKEDNWDNRLNLRHTLDLTSILEIQYLQKRLNNDDNDVV